MSKIFISYRRDDSNDSTGRLFDRLKQRYGLGRLVRDVDSIPTGVDFREYLANEVNQCQVLLAVIGRHWADIKDTSGKRRLDDPRDLVRIEIETALQREIPIVPVIVGGAPFPTEQQLPPSMRGLVHRNGVFVRPDPDFHQDVDRLLSNLDAVLKSVGASTRRASGGGGRRVAVLVAIAGVVLVAAGIAGAVIFNHFRHINTSAAAIPDNGSRKTEPVSPEPEGPRKAPPKPGVSDAVREQAMKWLRENNKWNPTAQVVRDVGATIENPEPLTFISIVGGTLLKSKKTTILAGRGDSFFLFELSPAQAQPFRPGGQHTIGLVDKQMHPATPDIVLSNLRIENADKHRPGTVQGSAQYRKAGKVPEKLAVRVVGGKKPIIPLERVALASEQGTLSFTIKDLLADCEPGPLVVFVELVDAGSASKEIVSNSLAAVVTIGQ